MLLSSWYVSVINCVLYALSQATLLQTRYIELLTLSGDYYKYLGELHKNMEELKVLRGTTLTACRINLFSCFYNDELLDLLHYNFKFIFHDLMNTFEILFSLITGKSNIALLLY